MSTGTSASSARAASSGRPGRRAQDHLAHVAHVEEARMGAGMEMLLQHAQGVLHGRLEVGLGAGAEVADHLGGGDAAHAAAEVASGRLAGGEAVEEAGGELVARAGGIDGTSRGDGDDGLFLAAHHDHVMARAGADDEARILRAACSSAAERSVW
jgi:hypothetical protein